MCDSGVIGPTFDQVKKNHNKRFGEFKFQYFGDSDVVNKLIPFFDCAKIQEVSHKNAVMKSIMLLQSLIKIIVWPISNYELECSLL